MSSFCCKWKFMNWLSLRKFVWSVNTFYQFSKKNLGGLSYATFGKGLGFSPDGQNPNFFWRPLESCPYYAWFLVFVFCAASSHHVDQSSVTVRRLNTCALWNASIMMWLTSLYRIKDAINNSFTFDPWDLCRLYIQIIWKGKDEKWGKT